MKKRLLSLTSLLVLTFLLQNVWAQTPVKPEQVPATTVQKTIKTAPTILKKPAIPVVKKYQTVPRVVDTVKNTDPTLNGQYKFMLSRSKSLTGYKLINPYRLTMLWQSVTDTLKQEKADLSKAKSKISEQAQTIAELQTQKMENDTTVNSSSETTEPVHTAADEISFLGMVFNKGTYHTIVWSVIAILIIALVIVIARSANSIMEAKSKTQLYDELTTEFQSFKSKSNEKERKLARELQDERNKLEELQQKK